MEFRPRILRIRRLSGIRVVMHSVGKKLWQLRLVPGEQRQLSEAAPVVIGGGKWICLFRGGALKSHRWACGRKNGSEHDYPGPMIRLISEGYMAHSKDRPGLTNLGTGCEC